ncbi:ABC transporter permease [Tunicatimonas pelagia]|uniref:ABC transporter permease n=1 Tax=Tunicatimonas pelagia TaxID=931531 RepID=UPI0026666B47|nr:ABC transporter permease [Tunicatimonas pelagia]WKN46267.1 ABC transporter permease [Tunicatimonas pelagia]
MLKNLLKVALRNIGKDRIYSLLNILGLTLGITCSLFLFLYLLNELSYDKFHTKKDRIYRVVTHFTETDNQFTWPSAQLPLAQELEEKYSQIEHAVRFIGAGRELFENPERDMRFYEEDFQYVDSTVFEVFDFPLLSGDPATALLKPNTAVLTQETAQKYFGSAEPIGQTLKNGDDIYEITGLVEDVPENSSIEFDALLSRATLPDEIGGWGGWGRPTYLLMKEGSSIQDGEEALASVNKERVVPIFENYGVTIDYWLQPLADIHLKSDFGEGETGAGDIAYIYIFGAVAFFILIIASINYMNLATARATRRAKEVGVRKTMGSFRGQLISQFLTESTLLTFIALAISLLLVAVLLSPFNNLAGTEIALSFLFQPQIIIGFILIALLVGIAGGSYPAFYLSKFNPALVLKGNATRGTGNAMLRKVLVVVQFAISIAMLICTWIVYDQLQYLRDKDLGFNQEQVLIVTMPDSTIRANYEVLQNRLRESAQVLEVSTSSSRPGTGYSKNLMLVEGNDGSVVDGGVGVNQYRAHYDYVETMGIDILQGRSFSREYTTDTAAVLVNESMVARMQWDDPIGKELSFMGDEDNPGPTYSVIGVFKDYHQESLYNSIEPLAVLFGDPNFFLNIKVAPNRVNETLAYIEDTWTEVNAGKPFSYEFLDEEFMSQYETDQKRGKIFTLFSAFTVIIACLGLLGLAAYTTEQRAKEIGIRKVIGATIPNIVGLIYKDFFILIALAMLVAFPLAYWFMSDWLQTFAYQTDIKWLTFVASALLTLIVTLGAISFHTLRAATANPVKSLRSE